MIRVELRSDDERTRLRHEISKARAILDGIMLAIEDVSTPPGGDGGQAITQQATTIAVRLARLDAYMRAEADTRLNKRIAKVT